MVAPRSQQPAPTLSPAASMNRYADANSGIVVRFLPSRVCASVLPSALQLHWHQDPAGIAGITALRGVTTCQPCVAQALAYYIDTLASPAASSIRVLMWWCVLGEVQAVGGLIILLLGDEPSLLQPCLLGTGRHQGCQPQQPGLSGPCEGGPKA